jgi:hypothetical protein
LLAPYLVLDPEAIAQQLELMNPLEDENSDHSNNLGKKLIKKKIIGNGSKKKETYRPKIKFISQIRWIIQTNHSSKLMEW